MVRLTYMIPTIGRTTLSVAIDSILEQLLDGDELFVIGDGKQHEAREIMMARQRMNVFYLEWGPTGHYGSEQIDYATQLARGNYICYLGDDDKIIPGAIQVIRTLVVDNEIYPHIFGMYAPENQIRYASIEAGLVSGQQIVAPNDKSRLPRYHQGGDGGQNDYVFIKNCLSAFGGYRLHHEIIVDGSRAGHGVWF